MVVDKNSDIDDPISYEEVALILYDWLTEVMEREGYSQNMLAKISGYSQANINRLIRAIEVEGDASKVKSMPSSYSLMRIANHTNYELPSIDRNNIPHILKKIKDKQKKQKK